MRTMNITFLFGLLIINSACDIIKDDCNDIITIINQSEKSIYAEYTFGYPDTNYFKSEPNPSLSPELNKVLAGEINTSALWSRSCWKNKFETYIPADTLMVYIFDAHILETTPWDTVKANYMILKRYDLSLDDLESMNWTITYP